MKKKIIMIVACVMCCAGLFGGCGPVSYTHLDFVLTDEEMKQIETLDTGKSLFFSHYSPETVEWFMSIV